MRPEMYLGSRATVANPVPEKGSLRIELFGELGALISLANQHPRSGGTGVPVTLGAGVGFEPTTFRL